MTREPLAYLITIHAYGSWLPGRSSGYVDRQHNHFGEPMLQGNDVILQKQKDQMIGEPIHFDRPMRHVVDQALREHAQVKQWQIYPLHVRTNHVHVVITAKDIAVEKVMMQCKAWATRRLREKFGFDNSIRVWSRHGSTRYLWTETQVRAAIHYVLHEQGESLD